MITLRPYQTECVEAVLHALRGEDSTLAVMATGLGKTSVFVHIAQMFPQVLIMAHRKELVEQAAERVEEQLGIVPGIEMASGYSNYEPIIVGSVQTLITRLGIPAPDLIIIDEAHHAVADTYREILSRYPRAKVLGVTATPDRADQLALGSVFRSVAYRYETPQAIEDGWLSPVIWSSANDVNGLIFESIGRRTVVFTPTVASAKYVAEQLGETAGVVHGAMPKKERTSLLKDFKAGRLTYMVNCNILTEGFDCPEIECVALLRTIKSRAMFVQCLGRGLRLAPGKTDCLYLDLTMDMPEHSLEGPDDVLGGIGVDFWGS